MCQCGERATVIVAAATQVSQGNIAVIGPAASFVLRSIGQDLHKSGAAALAAARARLGGR